MKVKYRSQQLYMRIGKLSFFFFCASPLFFLGNKIIAPCNFLCFLATTIVL
ncbi:hypothetical protein ACJIZ3_003736 [Penstemon smallii]|uniref:Uncharacterized protein n=2 Tax=Penstemon smallii TaxID=265156 RepID=A0ABD3UDW2_9LAMI